MQEAAPASLIGREEELSALDEFVRGLSSGRALVLTGEAGVGKTSLWEAGISAARAHGMRVLSSRPSEAEAKLSFASLTDLLDGVGSQDLEPLPAPQRRALEAAVLRGEPAEAPPGPFAVSAALLTALRSLAQRGRVVIAIDDVPWLDSSSAASLVFAARRLDRADVGFLLTRRPGRASDVEGAFGREEVRRVEVAPLSMGAIQRVLAERLGLTLPRRPLRRLFEASHGNPLYALELGRRLAEARSAELGDEMAVPEIDDQLLSARVRSLPGPLRRALLAVSLSGDLAVAQIAALPEVGPVEDTVEAGVLTVERGHARASHPLLAAAARRSSSAAERRALHLDIARTTVDLTLRARHLALAAPGPGEETAALVAIAAVSAAARGAVSDAVELAEHALRLTPPQSAAHTDRVLALAGYLDMAGELPRVTALLNAHLDDLPAGQPRARAHLLLCPGASVREHQEHLERALAESSGDPAVRSTVLAAMAEFSVLVRVERIPEAEAWASEAWQDAQLAADELAGSALHALAWARVVSGCPLDDLWGRSPMPPGAPGLYQRSIHHPAAVRLSFRGQIDEARSALQQLQSVADGRGEMKSVMALSLQLCELDLRAGDLEAARRHLDQRESVPGDPNWSELEARLEALLAALRGQPDEAERWAAGVSAEVAWYALEAGRARGIAALCASDPSRAAECLWTVWRHAEREGAHEPGAFPVAPDLVEALVELGQTGEALAVTERLTELAGQQQHPWGLATAKRCHAMVRLARAYDPEAAAALSDAADEYARLGLRFDRARSLLVLGRAQRRHRKWGAARGALEQAAAAFDGIASPGWAELARVELARVGARRPVPAGDLTPAELRVGELVAAGASNKEIARRLFVSVATVERHLSHIYAKLGLTSRTQLASHLARSSNSSAHPL